MRGPARSLLLLTLSLTTGLLAQSPIESATITPIDSYIDVQFGRSLANNGIDLDLQNLQRGNVELKLAGLGVLKVLPGAATFRKLRIEYSGDIPAGTTDFEVCFTNLKFKDGSSTAGACTRVFVPGSYVDEYTRQEQLLNKMMRGVATSKLNKPLKDVNVHLAVLDPKTASDAFGRRIGRRFLVFQVTIGNVNDDFDYLVHDVLLRIPFRLGSAMGGQGLQPQVCGAGGPSCTEMAELSSLELSILRGVAERGQSADPRNVMIRSFKGIGTMAAGLIGVTQLGSSYAPAVAAFNGPFVTSMESIFPDHTINQLNRLNDTAWLANRVVPRDHSIVMVGFVPQALLFSSADRKEFWKDAFQHLRQLTRVSIRVTGDFVAEVADVPPTITTVTFDDPQKFRDATPVVKGFVVGQFLSGATLTLGSGGDGMTVEIDGEAANDRIDFIVRSENPVPPNHSIEFVVTKGNVTRKHSEAITYQTQRPSITSIAPANAVQGAGEIELTVTGADFLPGADVHTDGLAKVGATTLAGSTELKVTVRVTDTTAAKKYGMTVQTIGGRSDPKTFEVKPPVPTVEALAPAEADQGAGEVEVTITGKNFVNGATVSTDGLEKAGDESIVSPTEMKVKVKIEAATAAKAYNFTVTTPGGTSSARPFQIKPKP